LTPRLFDGFGVHLLAIRTTEELLYVRGKLSMMLEQEPVRRVGVDLDLRAGNLSGK
jgi:hypothetical protein